MENNYFSFTFQVYKNCTCFPDDVAKDGRCTKDCFLYPLFFIGTMTGLMLHCMNIVPNQVATMRYFNHFYQLFAFCIGKQTFCRRYTRYTRYN